MRLITSCRLTRSTLFTHVVTRTHMATKAKTKEPQKPSRLLTSVMEKLENLKIRVSVSITQVGEHVIVSIGRRAGQMFKFAVDLVDEIVAFILIVVRPNMRERRSRKQQPA